MRKYIWKRGARLGMTYYVPQYYTEAEIRNNVENNGWNKDFAEWCIKQIKNK